MRPRQLLQLALAVLLLTVTLPTLAQPTRVVSINLCTDQLLLMLAAPEQITSISQLALEPNSSYMAEQAKRYPTNSGRAEEILALRPDLVVASQYTDPGLINLLRKLNLSVQTFPLTASIEDIENSIRRMADLLGHSQRGEKLINDMQARLRQVRQNPPEQRPRGAFYQPNGYTSGSGTLQDVALTLAGWDNISAGLGVRGYGSVDLERLLMARPQQLFSSAYAPGTESLAQKELRHPALRQITQGREIINISYKYWICGGPMIAEAVELLHRSLPE